MHRNNIKILRKCAIALLMSIGVSAFASTGSDVVVVTPAGDQYSVAMADVEAIQFESDGFTLKADGTDRYFRYDEVDRILVGAESSGINAIATAGRLAIWPSPVETILNVAGVEEGTDVKVYSLSGTLIATGRSNGGIVSLDMTEAPAGTCIVTVGERSAKIIRK